MSEPREAPYGTWSSPIGAAMLATAGLSFSEATLEDGVAYWLELRPAEEGRTVVVKGGPFSSPVDVTPEGFDVRSMAHEYGGGAACVHRGTVFFSNFADQRLYRLDPGAVPVAITPDTGGLHRFADGRLTQDGRWWIGVRERHDLGPAVADVVNELVAVPADGGQEPRIVASGHDFYSDPRISPDGSRLCFLAWDLPWMPWDGNRLYVARLGDDGSVDDVKEIAGNEGEESIWQPTWAPNGDIVFASDRSGWWNLERIRGNERSALHPRDAEFGYPQWVFGERSFSFLGDGRVACFYDRDGLTHLGILDPETGELLDLDLPFDALPWGPSVAAEGSTIVFIAAGATIPGSVVWLDFTSRSVEVLRASADVAIDPAYLPAPEAIEFPTQGDRTAHALFYVSANPDHRAPDGERPPLIVMAHGGPTANATGALDLRTRFWTSRGFAVVDVNYGGSTGYGRAYRQRLNGNWGVVDLEDCIAAATFLQKRGDVDGDRLLVRGGSAGGWVVMCALTFTDLFAAGATYYGIADLEPFATGETHKFESKYEHTMVGPWPEAADVYRARSPINSIDRLATPTLVLQGADDKVVPPSQAEMIVAALEAKGVPYAYLLFPGEGHGFRKAEHIIAAREAELSFYAQILGFEPADKMSRLAVKNLPTG
jgi:dipeptidyl aminopeptidase/acylaminoacyl peptidase